MGEGQELLTAEEVIAKIRKVPTTPQDTLYSRRRQTVAIRGDAIVFPLELETTASPEFVLAIKTAQKSIVDLLESAFEVTGKTWQDKSLRHQEKPFKKLKKLHLAFIASMPPSSVEAYDALKSEQNFELTEGVKHALNELLNKHDDDPIAGLVKECKINEDGHIVVRVSISPQQKLLECKNKLKQLFGAPEDRHTDPEKQTTLAAVIAVVDFSKLTDEIKTQIRQIVADLQTKLTSLGRIVLKAVEWIEYDKRTLSENSRLAVRKIVKTADGSPSALLFAHARLDWLHALHEHNIDIKRYYYSQCALVSCPTNS